MGLLVGQGVDGCCGARRLAPGFRGAAPSWRPRRCRVGLDGMPGPAPPAAGIRPRQPRCKHPSSQVMFMRSAGMSLAAPPPKRRGCNVRPDATGSGRRDISPRKPSVAPPPRASHAARAPGIRVWNLRPPTSSGPHARLSDCHRGEERAHA
jgi:hypothetical protein